MMVPKGIRALRKKPRVRGGGKKSGYGKLPEVAGISSMEAIKPV